MPDIFLEVCTYQIKYNVCYRTKILVVSLVLSNSKQFNCWKKPKQAMKKFMCLSLIYCVILSISVKVEGEIKCGSKQEKSYELN